MKKAPPDEERLSIQRCFSFKCRLNALLSFIFAIYLTALSIFHLSFALILIASRSICFHNRVRFLWLWSCLLWSFVGCRRCRGRSFCLAVRAGRCRCGCLMCRCALISCILSQLPVLSAAAVVSVALVATVAELLRLICAAFPR